MSRSVLGSQLSLTAMWQLNASRRGGRFRLAAITAGVAFGTTIFFLLLAAFFGFADQESRSAWIYTQGEWVDTETENQLALSDDELLINHTWQEFGNHVIDHVTFAGNPGTTLDIPGVGDVPAPGTYFASPAMADLIETTPSDQLGDRYGTMVGTISADALHGPESLVIVAGTELATADLANSMVINEFSQTSYASTNYQIVAIIGAIAVLIPVALLVSVIVSLGSAEHRERIETLRTLGATPRTVATMSALELGIVSLLGGSIGAVLSQLLAPIVARFPLGTGGMYSADLQLSYRILVCAVLVFVIFASAVAYLKAHRANVSAPGVTRQRSEKPPHWWTVVPLTAGVALLLTTATTRIIQRTQSTTDLTLGLYILGFVLIAIGLGLAGPYLTARLSGWLLRRARSGASVIALNRIVRTPRATYRAVGGMVLAAFVVTVFAFAMTTVDISEEFGSGNPWEVDESTAELNLMLGWVNDVPEAQLSDATAALREVDGVLGAAISYSSTDEGRYLPLVEAHALGLVTQTGEGWLQVGGPNLPDRFQIGAITDTAPPDLSADEVLVRTDGSTETLERARTSATQLDAVDQRLTLTPLTNQSDVNQLSSERGIWLLAYLGMFVATGIAALTLMIATVVGVAERRRVFGLQRLMGMPAATFRRIIVNEAGLPLVAVLGLSVVFGAIVAWSIVVGLTAGRRSIGLPEASYFGALAICAVLVLLAVASAIRMSKINQPVTTTRFD